MFRHVGTDLRPSRKNSSIHFDLRMYACILLEKENAYPEKSAVWYDAFEGNSVDVTIKQRRGNTI